MYSGSAQGVTKRGINVHYYYHYLKVGNAYIHEDVVVSRCFEPSQPLKIISGLKTNFNLSLVYSAHKSLNVCMHE